MKTMLPIAVVAIAAALAGCKVEKATDQQAPVAAAPADTSTPPPTAPVDPGEIPGAHPGVDIDAVPLSTAALGPFPFVSLPDGYETEKATTLDYARFPFWYNNTSNWVEGKFFQARLKPAAGKQMSRFELKKNFEALIQQMGGVQVAEGKLPYQASKSWGSEITTPFYAGLGGGYEPLATIWLVRRADGNIWLQLAGEDRNIGYVVGQEKGFAATATLLQATEMKQQIEQTGKVNLQVNFATDKTEILPDALPQIDQVVTLLKDNPDLKLAINGHTDNTGDAAHNQTLSEGRAKSVVAALTGKGIDAARLQAAGFGDTKPVADNGSEDGKARNRRVELVKQ